MLCQYDSADIHTETFATIDLAKLWIDNQHTNIPERGYKVYWVTSLSTIEVYKEFY